MISHKRAIKQRIGYRPWLRAMLIPAACVTAIFSAAACNNGSAPANNANGIAQKNSEKPHVVFSVKQEKGETFIVDGITFKMVRVDGGTFTMGATQEQASQYWDTEKPTHNVTLSTYLIGETEVTQALFEAVMGYNPSFNKDPNKPVEQLVSHQCFRFAQELSRITGRNFRLPTEAEWEYAARGGIQSRGYMYAGSNDLDKVAFYNHNSNNNTHSVAQKAPNELGLYDMSGNVWEWCSDWHSKYPAESQTNPQGPQQGTLRALRGGSWYSQGRNCRVSARYRDDPTVSADYYRGLRLALDN
ncbi:MAG: formylglycine-generating enzyme family protein [Bacteroidales bacterium]|nr:formylglycine-generating enzyme family protein [Bacteroidales bacterium]